MFHKLLFLLWGHLTLLLCKLDKTIQEFGHLLQWCGISAAQRERPYSTLVLRIVVQLSNRPVLSTGQERFTSILYKGYVRYMNHQLLEVS